MRLHRACPLLLLAAVCLAGVQASAWGQASRPGKEPPVEIRVESIVATYPVENPQPGRLPVIRMDKRLDQDGVGRRLASLFNFSAYRLMRHAQASTSCGQPVAFNLPGGHILHVQ